MTEAWHCLCLAKFLHDWKNGSWNGWTLNPESWTSNPPMSGSQDSRKSEDIWISWRIYPPVWDTIRDSTLRHQSASKRNQNQSVQTLHVVRDTAKSPHGFAAVGMGIKPVLSTFFAFLSLSLSLSLVFLLTEDCGNAGPDKTSAARPRVERRKKTDQVTHPSLRNAHEKRQNTRPFSPQFVHWGEAF